MSNKLEKLISYIREEMAASSAPTMSISGGKIAGTIEAGDDPPVRKRKRYIYQKNSRKLWRQG
jgi:hypothetical protein